MATVYTRCTRAEVERLIRSIPAILGGMAPDPFGIAQAVQLACGVELLSKIQIAFIAKSRGEPSEDGIVWPKLSPKTIARRRSKGREDVDILRDTGVMLASFSPGVFSLTSSPIKADFQIFDRLPGRVIVGTNRYPWHHTGVPGRLPKRELWPTDGNLPDVWWEDTQEVSVDALSVAIVHVLSGAGQLTPAV